MKPHLACDADFDKLTFPKILMPKIDGVRGLNLFGGLTGRSLKKHKNKFTTNIFSHSAMLGFDGELTAGDLNHPNLCALTTSAVGTINGEPIVHWNVFDYITAQTRSMPYWRRLELITQILRDMDFSDVPFRQRVVAVDNYPVHSMRDLETAEEYFLAAGYEGLILRDPNGIHKDGRCTAKEGAYLRVKRFIDAEIQVTRIEEGRTNNNEATTNALGQTERSTHQDNMVPNGMVGAMYGELLEDVVHRGKVLFPKGMEIKVAAGKMTHDERMQSWLNPNRLVGKIIKFQTLPIGIKDKPRMGTYQSHRMKSDIG